MRLIKTILPISPIGLIGLIGLIALTLTACSGGGNGSGGIDDIDDTPLVSGGSDDTTPISFSCGLAESQTVVRSGSMLSAERDAFKVWGYKNMKYDAGVYSEMQTVFKGYTVEWEANTAATTTSNTNNWEYVGKGTDQTIKFWDWSAKAYRFFAVTDWGTSSGAGGTYGPSDIYQSYNISMPADCSGTTKDEIAANIVATPYFSRLWFSTGDLVAYADKQFGKPVTLEFVKPYARVRFIYNYVYPREGIKILSQSFKPSDGSKIVRKGTVTIIYPLTGTDTRESFTMTPNASDDPEVNKALDAFTEDYDPEDDTKVYTTCDNGWYTVLPNNTQGSYTLTVTMKGINNGDPKTAVVPAEYMHWKPGYSYTYIFKITDVGGVEIGWVEYVVTPWTDLEADHTVYNW